MTKPKEHSARRQTDRLTRLKDRLIYVKAQLDRRPDNHYYGQELSSLEWAIPILEQHLINTFGEIPPERSLNGHKRYQIVTALIKRDGTVCYLCDEHILRRHMSIDHVIPLAKGGTNSMDNWKLTHTKCNVAKGNLLLEEYLKLNESEKST